MSEKRLAWKVRIRIPEFTCDSFDEVTVPSEGEIIVSVDDLRMATVNSVLCHKYSTEEVVDARNRLRALLPPEEPELLPCPYCGQPTHVEIDSYEEIPRDRSYALCCYTSDCAGKPSAWYATMNQAIKMGNRRPGDTP